MTNSPVDKPDLFGTASESVVSISSLGGNLHELPDVYIEKLIHKKFDDNPVSLIRQLSSDLESKERELILLRQEKFSREQLLIKLCGEYGNLSSIEIDRKLSSLRVERNADEVVVEMIGSAIKSELAQSSHQAPSITQSNNTSLSSQAGGSYKKKQAKDPQKNSDRGLHDREKIQRSHSTSRQSSTWLNTWFNEAGSPGAGRSWHSHSEESLLNMKDPNSSTSPRRPHSRSFPMPVNVPTLATRAPVELDSIDVRSEDLPPASASVDKYGFFNDIKRVTKESSVDLSVDPAISRSTHITTSTLSSDPVDLNEPPLADSSLELPNLLSATHPVIQSASIHTTTHATALPHPTDTSATMKLKQISKQHDEKTQQYHDQWETYFKGLLRDHYDTPTSDLFKDIFKGNLVKLDKYIHPGQPSTLENNPQPDSITVEYRTLHKLINKIGIPAPYRPLLWLELSHAKDLKVPGEFDRLVKVATTSEDPVVLSNLNQVNLDLHRTMPSNVFFNDLINGQPGPNYYRLQKILYAFVVYKSSIGYCQGMNKIISNLLLGINNKLSEEDIFWIWVGFVDDLLPCYTPINNATSFPQSSGTLSNSSASMKSKVAPTTSSSSSVSIGSPTSFFQSLPQISIDQSILADYFFPKFMPQLFAHLQRIGIQLEYITLNWWVSVFTENCLPLEIWIKVFDNLLVSNIELKLFSLSLALFKNFESLLLKIDNADEVYLVMKNLNQNSSTKRNLKYVELMEISKGFEKKIDLEEISRERKQLARPLRR
ncbi:hypothetical protein CAAN1_05S03532 [[Candida] anglica]|uniref:Rab-GAP TBC domain-containing protein n=1 Tax=[Candida] anglica TaxID=148631 RepID=A0ABP0EGG7_9ASCO